jgi:tetratricopeptide (TPR) repeat protein
MSLLRSGKTKEAREAALAAPPGPLRDVLDGRTSGDPDTALACYERALAAAPRFIDALIEVASIYEHRGRWREALALWQRSLEVTGNDERILARLIHARTRVT